MHASIAMAVSVNRKHFRGCGEGGKKDVLSIIESDFAGHTSPPHLPYRLPLFLTHNVVQLDFHFLSLTRNHRHINDDRITLLHALMTEHTRKRLNLFERFSIRDRALLDSLEGQWRDVVEGWPVGEMRGGGKVGGVRGGSERGRVQGGRWVDVSI